MSTNPNPSMTSMAISSGGASEGDHGVVPESKATPKDAQVITEILKDMGINEWEPKVVNQLLEFLYKYVTSIVDDSKTMSNHARKKIIDIEDVRLAVQMYNEQNFVSPPSRDILLEVARNKNANPLPTPKPVSGIRLPPDRFCLTSANYRLKYKRLQNQSHQARSGATYTIRQGSSNSVATSSASSSRPIITMNQTVMPRFQIQSGSGVASNNSPAFTMTIPAVKRKANDD